MVSQEIFREYDIRGVVGRDFDEKFAFALGRTYATYLAKRGVAKNSTVTIGHDARLSSPSLAQAMIDGLQTSGVNVVFLGLVTTPVAYYSLFEFNDPTPAGGIMITGSHNPPDYNGFKISFAKSSIYGEEIQALYKILATGDFVSGSGTRKNHDIFPNYLARYKKEFAGLKPVPVVLDCGNGAAGCIARRLYEGVGLKPEILFEEPDGKFPNHHPDPTVEKNLDALKAAVKKNGAMIGIGFDGDADRVGVVDENGRFILGDEMMAIISRGVLQDHPGAKIIGDVKCSDRLYDDIRKHGGKPIMFKTGHSLVKAKIKEEGAPFGGELSGHIFFADRNYGYDDALYAGLRLVEMISRAGKPLSALLTNYPSAFSTPEIRIDTTEEKKRSIVETLRAAFNKPSDDYRVNLIDGIRISFVDGWALARASNTQPVLVLRFESTTQQGLDRIRGQIEQIVNPLL